MNVLSEFITMVKDNKHNFVSISALLFLFISIFSGRYSIDRLLKIGDYWWLELRFIFLVLAIISVCFLYKLNNYRFKLNAQIKLYLILIICLFLVYLINLLYFNNTSDVYSYVQDVLFLFLTILTVLVLFNSPKDLFIFFLVSEAIGLLLIVICLFTLSSNGLTGKWSALGGPITFYRLEFLTFCAALYLMYMSERNTKKIVHLFIAIFALFSSLMTLAKAALLGSMAVIIYIIVCFAIKKDYKTAVIIMLIAVISYSSFSIISGSKLQSRIKKVTDVNQPQAVSIPNIKPEPSTQEQPAEVHIDKNIQIKDTSDRLGMTLYAWKLFSSNKIFGIGTGNYEFKTIDNYNLKINTYCYPHNILLEVLVNQGLVGLTVFVLVLFFLFIIVAQKTNTNTKLLFVMGYMIFVFVTALFSGDYYDFRAVWYLGAIVLSSYKDPHI